MENVTVHYMNKEGKLKHVTVFAFHPDEVFWIGARKAGMSKAEFVRSIIQLDTEKISLLK